MSFDAVEIPLRARDGSVRAYALVDAEDAPLSEHRWCLSAAGYAVRKLEGKVVFLHRILCDLAPGDGLTVDHINGDRMDNRRANLRVLSMRENAQNRRSLPGSTSEHKGVHWCSKAERWVAQGQRDGKRVRLGTFTDEHEAGAVAAEYCAQNLPYSPEAMEAA